MSDHPHGGDTESSNAEDGELRPFARGQLSESARDGLSRVKRERGQHVGELAARKPNPQASLLPPRLGETSPLARLRGLSIQIGPEGSNGCIAIHWEVSVENTADWPLSPELVLEFTDRDGCVALATEVPGLDLEPGEVRKVTGVDWVDDGHLAWIDGCRPRLRRRSVRAK